MNVGGECLGDAFGVHQSERKAVGQSPFFVGSGEIEVHPVIKQAFGQGLDLIPILRPQPVEEIFRLAAAADAGIAIANLQQDSPMQHQDRVFVEKFAIQLFGSLVVRVASVLQSNQETRIQKDEASHDQNLRPVKASTFSEFN